MRVISNLYDEAKCHKCGMKWKKGQSVYYQPGAARGQKTMCYPACGSVVPERDADLIESIELAQQPNQEPIQLQQRTTPPVSGKQGLPTPSNPLVAAIWDSLSPYMESINSAVDAEQVRALVAVQVGKLEDKLPGLVQQYARPVQRIEIVTADQTVQDMGIQHRQFGDLLKRMSARHNGARLNYWIAGPAGTGKTSAVMCVAKALGLEYASTGAIVDTVKIFGYMNGSGNYVSTLFRKIWEHGGVFLFDDCDGSDAGAMVELNSALANGTCAFPDGQMVSRHKDCLLVLTANTFGNGGTDDYVGRTKQDRAFLDRFIRIKWDIDEDLEYATCDDSAWCKLVQKVRAEVTKQGIKALITPRASYYGAALLAVGISRETCIADILTNTMTAQQWDAVWAAIPKGIR